MVAAADTPGEISLFFETLAAIPNIFAFLVH